MYLADTLSRGYLTETHTSVISKALENVDHTTSLAITKERLFQIQYASADDPLLVSGTQASYHVRVARPSSGSSRNSTCVLRFP